MLTIEQIEEDVDKNYTDSFGLVTVGKEINYDGGDSSHKVSHYGITKFLQESISGALLKLMKIDSIGLRRHPDTTKWYSELNRFSRDQFAPRVILSALLNHTSILKDYFKAHLKHLLLFTWNTRHNWVYPEGHPNYNPNETLKYSQWKLPDLTGPEFWGFYIRGFRCKLLYPLLILSDLETLLSAIVKRFDKDPDINNCLAACLLAKKVMPTGLGHLAYLVIKPVLKDKLRKYWTIDHYEPPIGELYIKTLDL